MARALPVVLAMLCPVLASCTTGGSHPARGSVRPTVEGAPPAGAPAAFADLDAARAAFTRTGGPLTAVLDDAAWIRYEPDPDRAPERHVAYFQGLTAFEVVVVTKQFARPTEETYLLEDSTGARVTAKPERYRGDMLKFGSARFQAAFTLEFAHTTSKDVKWVRLTRQGLEGGTVQWDF